MRRITLAKKRLSLELVANMELPSGGQTMTEFGERMRWHPAEVPEIVRYLHNKRLVWKSERGGHMRVFPISAKPGRGNPPEVERNVTNPVEKELVQLLSALVPNFLWVRQIEVSRPKGKANAVTFASDQARHVEAAKIVKRVRRFQAKHPHITPEAIREALWFDRPELMSIVSQSAPELGKGEKPFSEPETRPKKMEANLSADDRIHRYVKKAGKNGIAAYEIAKKFRNEISTDEVTHIGNMLADGGMIHVFEMRKSGMGRKTARFFDIAFTPEVKTDGTFYMR